MEIMNLIANELEKLYPEVSAMEFYREIFPDGELDQLDQMTKGKYIGIAVEVTDQKKSDGRQLVKRYSVTDDLDVVDELTYSDQFCIMAPISYIGKNRKSENARIMYALCIELDNLLVEDGKQVGLQTLINQWSERVHWIPCPTYLVASGTGVHLYYLFEKGVPLFTNVVKSLEKYKRAMTKMIWNRHVTESCTDATIQQESVFQAFRMVGTITKHGDRVRAFQTGERISVEYMNRFLLTQEKNCCIEEAYKSNLSKAEAKEKYPEWYEKRVVQHQPKGRWICKRDLYEWWKRRIREEAVVGHRYYCMMILCIYAIKCNIDREELENDCFELMHIFEERTDQEDNHFTAKDVIDAMQCYEDEGLITYPISSIENRSGLHVERNKRNYRKQADHIILMNTMKQLKKQLGEPVNEGRPSKEAIVKEWRNQNPDGRKADCIRETGLSKPCVYKWW